MKTHTFLVADDHEMIRRFIQTQLKEIDPGARILEASTQEEAYRILLSVGHQLDAAILDLSMPGGGKFDLLRKASSQFPDLSIIVISASETQTDVDTALDSGAVGYIPKTMEASAVSSAIQMVLTGGVYAPEIPDPMPPPSPNDHMLTDRQRAVLALIGQGLSNREIGERLGIAENTVKIHVTAILRALDADNRTQATIKAKDLQLI